MKASQNNSTVRAARAKHTSIGPTQRITAAVIAGVLGILFTALPANAGIVAFENPAGPGHFEWFVDSINTPLNTTLPASAQPDFSADASITHSGSVGAGIGVLGSNHGIVIDNFLVVGFDAGDEIGAALTTWDGSGFVAHPAFGTAFAEDEDKYVGFRFDTGAGLQYGWIGVRRTGVALDAFAWGYETEVGVPIAAGATGVPAPGGLAVLAFGAAGLSRGRRRKR